MDARLKKAIEKARASVKVREAAESELHKSHPLLAGLMTCTEGTEKGKHRDTSTMFVFVQDGSWKIVLGEKGPPECSLWASGASLAEALDVLEGLLGSESPDWRVKTGTARYAKKK